MKLTLPAGAGRSFLRRLVFGVATAAIAVLALPRSASAQTVNIYYVTWDASDATDEIQDAIDNAVSPSKIILTHHTTPWYTNAPILLNKSNMQIWFANGAKVMTKAGGHTGTGDPLFRVTGDNVKINGYYNGVDASAGVATLEMRKTDYMSAPYVAGESRHCINVRGAANTIIQGLILKKSGGDGIAINPKDNPNDHIPASNVIINDVTCDDNYRQGISIISVDTLTATDCVFKNTGLTGVNPDGPGAGVDIEPSRGYDTVKAVKFVNCEFTGNAGNDVEINLRAHDDGLAPAVDIRFESCLVGDGDKNGIAFIGLDPTNGPTGTIVVKNTTVTNTTLSGLLFNGWSSDRITVTMANVDLIECNPSGSKPPILFTQNDPAIEHGDVIFQSGCHIHESFTRSNAFVYAGAYVQAAGLKDITGAIDVHRPSGATNSLLTLGSNTTNCTLSVTIAP